MTTVTARHPRPDPLVPHEHGAWAFLLLPVALSLGVTGWSAALPLVVATWVCAYPAAWATSGLAFGRGRRGRFRRAARVWVPLTVAAGTPLLALHPWLCWVLLTYTGLHAATLQHARRHRERSLTADLVLVAQCSLLVPVLGGLAAATGPTAWVPPVDAMLAPDVVGAAVLCALALVGSTLHVKSLIRERADPAYATASRLFAAMAPAAAVAVSLAAGWGVGPVLAFAALTVRAWALRRPDWRPARIGLAELAGLVGVVAGVALSA
ncbi:YwiC-like family protein [Nocardioides sp. J2M5]|uniref:YwiC-like family protein n=1 Tax=Nocardioides palaemonis TaxID=2829810 RepID=UPI001BAD992F|nr:YwiC-like family protein [Nocardioides palaemonis]MBS2938390.1 YwiC-like family protein [Nocardioides palaemonis]